tara:strand:+ start:167 stop:352 length:186 start_codon:yes stop_codon:yes gene_type:complete
MADQQAKKNTVLQELKQEINETLLFFVKTDLEIYGKITADTRAAFDTQGVKFPEQLKEFNN